MGSVLLPKTALALDSYNGAPSEGWLVDCVLTGGSAANGNPGMPAIRVPGSVRTWRCTLTGGSGSTGLVSAVQGSEVVAPLLASSSPGTPVVPGSTFRVDLTGDPGDPIFLLAAFQLGAPDRIPLVEQPLFAFALHGAITVGLQFGDPTGRTAFPIAIPNDAALRNMMVWFRGLDAARLPLQASALLPMTVR
jgi:hypothetical protein